MSPSLVKLYVRILKENDTDLKVTLHNMNGHESQYAYNEDSHYRQLGPPQRTMGKWVFELYIGALRWKCKTKQLVRWAEMLEKEHE